MSDNNGLENTKYKLIKNEDKLILTDKKTLKSRVLEVDDIDYVVDDNQRLRDPNVIENYFRLKDEPYEQKMMTKTADYVKEQKEAEKLYSPMKYEDLIDEFIKKYNLTTMEIKTFSQIPDETTIKKLYGRTDEDKKAMINDFKILKKKLTENKNLGTDIFSYLKSYFANYTYNTELMELYDEVSFETYIKDKSFYKNEEDYNKIKNKNIKSLQDLIDENIGLFGGINLKFLKILIEKYKRIADICEENQTYFKYDSNHLADALTDKYIYNLNLMAEKEGKGGGEEEDNRAVEDAVKLYNKLSADNKNYFNDWIDTTDYETFRKRANEYFDKEENKDLLELYSRLINENVFKKFKSIKEPIEKPIEEKESDNSFDSLMEDITGKKPSETKKETKKETKEETKKPSETKMDYGNLFDDYEKEKIEKGQNRTKGYLSIHNDIIYELYKRNDSFKKMSPLDKDEQYDTIQSFISKIIDKGLSYFDANFKIQIVINVINSHKDKNLPYEITAYYWGVLNKTDKLQFGKPLREYISGEKQKITQDYLNCGRLSILQNFFNKVLKPILEIVIEDINVAKGLLNNKALGWTDNTLTRIEKISDTLREYSSGGNNMSSGWTDDTLTRIEKISDTLREYSSGRINTSLLNVMKKTKMSSGWTDDTLTRIEKINNVLKDY